MINGYINEPPQFSVIARVNGELWRKFQLAPAREVIAP
jgi:hypothetical protein